MIFKKVRTYYWLTQSFLARHYRTILSSSLITLLLFLLVSFSLNHLPAPKQTFRLGRVGKFNSNSIPLDIKRHLSLGLISLDEKGNIKPAMADHWQISPDGKNYTFHLKSLTWHDGKSLQPQDIKLPFKEVKTSYPDSKTINFTLQEPFAPFLYLLTQPILKDQKYGVGKFYLQQLKFNQGILQRIVIASSQQKLIYKFYPTEDSLLTAFQLGEIDQVQHLTYYPKNFENQPHVDLKTNTNYWKIATLFFNNNDSNLSNKSIRQALAYAIKNKSFGNERAISPISKKSWAFNPNVKTYDYNLEHAQKLFQENVKDPTSFQLEIKTALQYLDIAEQIASDWQQAFHIKVNVSVNPNFDEGYQVALIDFHPSLDPDQYPIWHSTQATNFTHYQDLKVDKLLEDGRKTLDRNLRKEIYQEFQRFLLEDAPAVFLFYPKEYTLIRHKILPF